MSFDDMDDYFLDGDDTAAAVAEAHVFRDCTFGKSSGAPLYLDLESQPDFSRINTFDLPPLPEIPSETPAADLPDPKAFLSGTADSIKKCLSQIGVCSSQWLDALVAEERGGKDRSGVLGNIASARNAKDDVVKQHADRIKLLSVVPEYCQIACLSMAIGNEAVQSYVLDEKEGMKLGEGVVTATEPTMLRMFWDAAINASSIIAFNGLSFDIPVILVRSILLDVPTTRMFDRRPWGTDILDPYIGRFGSSGNSRKDHPGKLKELSSLLGIENDAPDFDGSMVYAAMNEEGYAGKLKVGTYCRSDVNLLRAYFKRMSGYFWT